MPKIYQLCREQTIATNLATAWDYISSPQNLDKITPSDMAFEIISQLPQQMYNGLLIEYRVGIPLMGKQTWLTELKHIREQQSFVDEQRIGPYKFWYHYHEIQEVSNGVRFIDKVTYAMPYGPLGAIARMLYVRNELNRIFDHRHSAMQQQLGKF
tara:strand:- start:60 stop:524 length:465 start_codon:yes stop_codon:yes gene_type:complete